MQSQPPPKTGNRLRLDIQSQLPPFHMIDLAFSESKTRRGCLVEIPWRTKKPGQMFTLTCQWEDGADLPVWSLYEQAGEESKMHWSKPFGSADLQLLYDMAAMAAVDSEGSSKIPDSLKAKESQKLDVSNPGQQGYPPPPVPGGSDFTQGTMPAYPNPYGNYPPPGYAMPQQMYPPPMPGYPPPMPGYPMPQQMYPPMPGMMPGMPGMPGDPNAWMQQGMPGMAPGMAPGMNPAVASGAYPAAAPPAPAPAPGPAPTAMTPLVGDSGVFRRIDLSLISKTQTLDLGTLLLNAHLIKQNTLEAALKIQGMVDDGKLDPEIAPAALERFHSEGSRIDSYLTGDVLEKMRDKSKQAPAAPPPAPKPKEAGSAAPAAPAKDGAAPAGDKPAAAPVKKGQKSPEEIAKIRNAFDLLKKAGIITDTDIQTAQTVLRKHGGDIVDILISAGKFDRNTFEAADIVRPLIDATLMKLEQAIIVLNYCCRSRVDFDTAIDEMGWQNPRKVRKDLKLD
jgi:hypothetical protein